MTDSVHEQILQKVVDYLATISIANGYQNDIASIQRPGVEGQTFVNMPLLYVADGEDAVQRDKRAGETIYRQMELFITVGARPTDLETRSGSAVLNSPCADVERCLMTDPTLGGLAVRIDNPDFMEAAFEDDRPHLAKAMRFTIDYRHKYRDPTVAA